jgi:hypothetical protein
MGDSEAGEPVIEAPKNNREEPNNVNPGVLETPGFNNLS